MSYDSTPAGSTPARRLRAVNASLSSIEAGMKPVLHGQDSCRQDYFKFANGQVRRQVGQGHYRVERLTRRKFRAARRDAVKARP